MVGTIHSMRAKVAEICEKGIVQTRILTTIFTAMLSLSYRNNFKRLAEVAGCNENTIHNWMIRTDIDLTRFNKELIKREGGGDYVVLFDPSFISKSGKKTPGLGKYWSGQSGQVKHGLDAGCLAVGDKKHHTAYHLKAEYTPSPGELGAGGKTLVQHYTNLVCRNAAEIKEFGGFVVADAYFGTKTFVRGLQLEGLELVSCLKSNAVLHYEAERELGKKRRGRPAQKGERINWKDLRTDLICKVQEDGETRIRSGIVWSKSLRAKVLLVRVEFLNEKGEVRTTKLFFCTDLNKDWKWVWDSYRLRFQIEFQFRDGKQHLGLTHCQSTNKVKMENHLNLSLTSINLAKICHWKRDEASGAEPFSLPEIKSYYQNLNLLHRFTYALNLNPEDILNNPKIISILYSDTYENQAA